MSEAEKRVPELRFKGFIVDWEQRKLGELLAEVKRPIKMKDDECYELVTVKRRNGGIVSRGIFKGKDVLVKSQFQIKTGDYLISKRQVVHGANGIVPSHLNNAIVSNEYLVSIGNKNITTDFLTIISRLPSMYRKFFLSSYGIDIEKLVFNVEDWKKRTIRVPGVSEQNQISIFYKQIDSTIALHQRKLTLLKQLKQTYLDALFPQNDEHIPVLRFSAFSDSWEERKFSNIVNRVSLQSNDSNLPKVEFEDIVSGEGRLNKDISQKFDSRKGTFFEPKFILYGKLRPYLKNWLFPNFKGIALGDFWVFEPKNSSSIFDYYLIQSDRYQTAANLSSGTKMPRSDWKIVSETVFNIPNCIEEQEKIGAFFKQFDDAIALHQGKLEKLIELKNVLLGKMFL